MTPSTESVAVLLSATGRADVADALQWIAEGRSVRPSGTPIYRLLQALVEAVAAGLNGAQEALRVTVKRSLSNSVDTSADLLNVQDIRQPAEYEAALRLLASFTPSGTLADVTAEALAATTSRSPLVIETLALVAGLSWRDLRDRATTRGDPLPSRPDAEWSLAQIEMALKLVDESVTGKSTATLPGAVAARPIELLFTEGSEGWMKVDHFLNEGVSYGDLLAQRDVGSAWGAHRNRTSSAVSAVVTRQILDELEHAGIGYWSTEGDGENRVSRSVLNVKATGVKNGPGQLTLVTRTLRGEAGVAVLVTAARDGGTARKTAATLLKVPDQIDLPTAVVLVGSGWANRGETDSLVTAFSGRVFNESRIAELVDLVRHIDGVSEVRGIL